MIDILNDRNTVSVFSFILLKGFHFISANDFLPIHISKYIPVGIKIKQSSPSSAALIASSWLVIKLCRPNFLWKIFIISFVWGKLRLWKCSCFRFLDAKFCANWSKKRIDVRNNQALKSQVSFSIYPLPCIIIGIPFLF